MKDDSLQYIQDCFCLLMAMNIIDSQYQFSQQFLNRCKNYYSVLIAQQRSLPNDALYLLNEKMTQLSECFDDERLTHLAQQGKQLLNNRFERFMMKR